MRSTAIVALLLLSSCGTQDDVDTARDPLPVAVGIIPIAEVAPIYVGIDRGYFEREGLQLRLHRMDGGAAILQGLASGSVDIGFSNVVSLLAFHANLSEIVAFIGGTYETPSDRNHALMVEPGFELRTGERIVVGVNTRNNIEELMLRGYMISRPAHARPEVIYRAVPFPAMQSALQRGEIDVASLVEPFITQAQEQGLNILDRQYLTGGNDTVLVATYVVRQEWLRQSPEAASRFRRAFTAATEFMRDPLNESEVRRIIAEQTSMPPGLAATMGLPLMLECVDVERLQAVVDNVEQLMPDLLSGGTPAAADLVQAEAQCQP